MNSYETVNDVLVKLFNEIMDVEERALITSEYKDISVNDMHVIEAIGIREPKNMSTVARAVSVTVGTLTIAINHLVKKGYVERSRSEEDRRVVLVSLSEKGRRHIFITECSTRRWSWRFWTAWMRKKLKCLQGH